MDISIKVAESGNFLPTPTNDHSFARSYLADGISFGASKPILNHVIGIILVFFQIIPRSAFDLFPIDGKQPHPRIFLSRNPVACHHRRNCPEGHAVTAITSRHKLPLGIFPDVRQAIGTTNNLSRPTMINTRRWNYFFQASEQARISSCRVSVLARLVIFPAEDDVIEATAFIDSQIIVRLSRIPKDGFRNCADWHSGAEDI